MRKTRRQTKLTVEITDSTIHISWRHTVATLRHTKDEIALEIGVCNRESTWPFIELYSVYQYFIVVASSLSPLLFSLSCSCLLFIKRGPLLAKHHNEQPNIVKNVEENYIHTANLLSICCSLLRDWISKRHRDINNHRKQFFLKKKKWTMFINTCL